MCQPHVHSLVTWCVHNIKRGKTKPPTRLVTNRINTSEWNLNQPSEQETPRSCCYFLNAFIGCHFFPPCPFPLLNFHTMSLLWPSPDVRTKTKSYSWILYWLQLQLKLISFWKPEEKHWGREERKTISRESSSVPYTQGISFMLCNYSLLSSPIL